MQIQSATERNTNARALFVPRIIKTKMICSSIEIARLREVVVERFVVQCHKAFVLLRSNRNAETPAEER